MVFPRKIRIFLETNALFTGPLHIHLLVTVNINFTIAQLMFFGSNHAHQRQVNNVSSLTFKRRLTSNERARGQVGLSQQCRQCVMWHSSTPLLLPLPCNSTSKNVKCRTLRCCRFSTQRVIFVYVCGFHGGNSFPPDQENFSNS